MEFSTGMEVEVRSDETGLKGSWYEGTIVRSMPKKNRVSVEYRTLVSDENESIPLREVVDLSLVRPTPPTLLDEEPAELEPSQRVDAFHLDGWWEGSVVKKDPKTSRYVVYFPDSDENIEFERSKLRVQQVWDGKKWVVSHEEEKKDSEGKHSAGDKVVQAGDIARQGTAAAIGISASSDSRDENKRNSFELAKRVTHGEDMSVLPRKKSKKEATESISSPITCHMTRFDGETLSEIWSRQISNMPKAQVRWRVKMLAHRKNALSFSAEKQQRAGTEGDLKVQKNRKITKPRKIARPEKQLVGVGDEQEKPHGSQTEPITTLGLWVKDSKGQELLNMTQRTSINRLEETPNASAQIKGDEMMHEEQKCLHRSSRDKDKQRNVEKASAVNPSCKELSPLPFVKSSPVWKVLESDVVFNTMPQSPHFHPLEQCSKVLREGMAIGHTVAFSNLADATCKLQLGDHRSDFENMFKDLVELEQHGFNGQLLRARLEQLLRLKDSFLQSEDKLVEAEGQILEQQCQKDHLNAEIDTVDGDIALLQEKIALLQEKRASILKTRKKTEADVKRLQREVQMIKEASRDAEEDFKKAAAAPWSAFLS